MIYVRRYDDEQEQAAVQREQQPQTPVISSGGSGDSMAPVGGQTQAANRPTATSSGQFMNIQQLLSANKAGAEQLAGQVAGRIEQEAQEGKQALGNVQNQFTQNVQQGTPTFDANVINQAIQNPVQATANQDLIGRIARMRSGQFTGPTSITQAPSYAEAQKEVEEAKSTLNLANTPGGRQQLIRQVSDQQSPGFRSRGGLSFDQLLLQNVEPARQRLEQTTQQLTPALQEKEQSVQRAAQEEVEKARQTAQQTQRQTTEALTGALTAEQQRLNQAVQQEQQRVREQQEQASRLAAERFTPKTTVEGTPEQRTTQQRFFVDDVQGPKGTTQRQYLTENQITRTPQGQMTFNGRPVQVENVQQVTPAQQRQVTTLPPITDAELATLGITRDQYNEIGSSLLRAGQLGLQPGVSGYLQLADPNAVASLGTVATPEDGSRLS